MGVGFEFLVFNVKLNDKVVKLQIWDTCGQEIYRSLISSFYRNASLAMMVYAIDNKDVSLFTETLELVTDKNILNLNVTNRSYFATVKFTLEKAEKFKAPVNAKTFLSLISKITTDTIDLSVKGNTLKIKANGEYTLPMIYNNEEMLSLPKIDSKTYLHVHLLIIFYIDYLVCFDIVLN